MNYMITFTVQKRISVPEETDQETDEQKAITETTKELEVAGWHATLDSFEPEDEEDEDDDEDDEDEDLEDEEDDDEEEGT